MVKLSDIYYQVQIIFCHFLHILKLFLVDFVDHIEYIIDLIGIEHVGVSSDFDGGGGISGWNDASETFNITLELVKRGYTETEISKLWSGNLLRVLDEVQRVAKSINQTP